MSSIRAARRYRWRLAGGRLISNEEGFHFVPNRLEKWRVDTAWQCKSEDVIDVRVRRKMWLELETAVGTETFRIRRASAVASGLNEAVHVVTVAEVLAKGDSVPRLTAGRKASAR